MKRKVVIGLAIYSFVFLSAGAYVILTIRSATSSLDRLITLHQVEILREHYLLEIKRVQADLTLRNTEYARNFDTMIKHVMGMGNLIDTCFECHHSPRGMERLNALKAQTERYKDGISRVLTLRANASRRFAAEAAAFGTGEELIRQVGEMIAFTTSRLEENTQKAMAKIERTRYFLYALIGLGPLLSVGLGFVFLSGITNPLKVLVDSTRKLKGGNLDHRVVGLKHEFGELASSFNEMAGALKEQMQKMQRTEQMAVVGELAAGLAHEIKNPMAGIKVAMSVLSEEAYISGEDKVVLQKVVAEVAQLEGLMKSFLNFAKPQKPRFETVNLNQMLNTTLTFHLKHRAVGSGDSGKIEIVKEFGEVPPTQADPTQLQQVFLNLFLNALHAMPRGGELRVRTGMEEDGKRIRIEVADTGSGIREDLIDKVFHPFYTTKPKGTGLGLAISRQLIEQHDGAISVANRPGGGALFTILLPVKAEGTPV
ncbi:MAG: sensor histidine kinase [Deltaproteobacteria bacterium]|nr:MAG: sensor histidine kinase [Deltaproteobacteria bacterium]